MDDFSEELRDILEQAKLLAKRYYRLTGRILGVTGEVGEMTAARLLDLKLADDPRQKGYDAVGSDGRKVQIKTRRLLPDSKPSQRVGSIKIDSEWDTVVLVLLNEDFEPTALFEAPRSAVVEALAAPGSKARNERGALATGKFISLAQQVWPG